MVDATCGSRLGEYAVYPGTFDPVTPGQHGAGVIIRGVRNRSDLRYESQLAAMNEAMGISTLLLPAQPGMTAVSSTALRGLAGR